MTLPVPRRRPLTAPPPVRAELEPEVADDPETEERLADTLLRLLDERRRRRVG